MRLVSGHSPLRLTAFSQGSPSPQQKSLKEEDSPYCAEMALKAYQQGLLGQHYFDNGWKQTVTIAKIPGLMQRGFSLQLAENGKFYLTRGLMGGAPKEFISTKALAEELKKTDLKDRDYAAMQELALNVINLFSLNHIKTKPLIEEVTALAYANNTVITKSLLKVLVREINQGELLDVDLLKSLKTTLINSLIDALDPDDLIQVLQITMRRITEIHKQDKTNYKLYAGISTISDILDVMGDANVIKVGRIKLHDPLYEILDTLSDHDDTLIAAQAAYAKQSLVRVPNDETKLRSTLRRGTAFAQGVTSLCKVVTDKDLSSLLSAYDNFKKAVDFQEGKKQWYGDVRILKLLNEKRDYDLFSKVMDTRIQGSINRHIVGNILFILQDVAHNDPDLNTRKWAIDRMLDLFLDDAKWGDKKQVKKSILAQLVGCAALPDEATVDFAKEKLNAIGDKKGLTDLQKRLIVDVLEDLPLVTPKSVHHVETPSNALIIAATRPQAVSMEQKIEQLRTQTLENEEVLKELASYIPVLGSRRLFDPKEQTFDLDKAMDEFLKGNNKVFLLLGDSGGGKSTYLRYLENRLWKNWDITKPIPLFISLPALKLPFKEAVSEALKERGFTEQDQKELKSKHSFIFLMDGYDELKQKKNLFVANQLNQWKGQTIITCRTQYLSGEQSSYQSYFAPPTDNVISTVSMDEASTSPFTQNQIESYCRKFIELHKIPRTWQQYNTDIASVPDLAEMIVTPFLLRIIAEVLPSIIESHKNSNSQERLRLLRIEIFDAFVKNWFYREELKIQQREIEHNIPDIKEAFVDFATRLALEMMQDDLVSVDYKESSSLFDQTPSKWAKYFSSDSKTSLVRSGVPIRKTGPYSFAFIHKSLLEYFGARAIIPQEAFKPQHIANTSSSPPAVPVHKQPEPISYDEQSEKLVSQELEIIPQEAPKSQSISSSPPAVPVHKQPEPISYDEQSEKLVSQEPEIIPQEAPQIQSNSSSSSLPAVPVHKQPEPISYDNLSKKILSQEPEIIPQEAPKSQSISSSSSIPAVPVHKQPEPISYDNLSKKILSQEPEIIRLLAECVTKDPSLTKPLFEFIERSKQDPQAAIGASNAITILNAAQINLSGRDFKGIRIPEADLSHALMTNTNLSYANLTKANLTGALLDYSTFAYSEVAGLELGQRPYIQVPGELYSFAISPDGKRVLSGSYDGTVRLWDFQTGKKLHSFTGRKESASSVAFSPNGKWALSGSGKTVQLWDCQTGKKLQSFAGHSGSVDSVAFSPDGKWVLSGSDDKTVRLWDCQTGKELRSFQGHSKTVNGVAFSPDGKWALSVSADETVRLWDCESATELQSFSAYPHNAAFSPNGKWVLSPGGQTVILWDCQTGKELRSFLGHNESVNSVAFSPDGKWVLSGSNDKTVRLWDCQTGQELRSFLGHTQVRSVAFSPDGKWALFGSSDNTIRIWNVNSTSNHKTKNAHSHMTDMNISSDGKLAFSSEKNKIKFWDCQTGQQLRFFQKQYGDHVVSLAFSSNGKWALSGRTSSQWSSGGVMLWDCQTGEQLRSFEGHEGSSVCSVAFSPDGKRALSGGDDYTVRLWDCQTGQELKTFLGHEFNVCSVAFSPDGKRALSGSRDKTVRLWDCQTGKELKSFLGHSFGVDSVAFSPDGKWALSGSEDNTVRLWDCQTGKELRSFLGHSFRVDSVEFSPDGKWAISGSYDRTVRLWDCQTGKQIYCLKLGYFISKVRFLPDGKEILISTQQQALQRWRLFDEQGYFRPMLKWSTGDATLSAENLNIEGTKDLSESNERLLIQYGAIEHSASSSTLSNQKEEKCGIS